MNNTPTFPESLRRAREQRGLSQSRLAVRARLDHSYVCRLENDTRSPTRQTVIALAAALDLDDLEQDELLMAADKLPESKAMRDLIASAMTHRRQVEQKREAWAEVAT